MAKRNTKEVKNSPLHFYPRSAPWLLSGTPTSRDSSTWTPSLAPAGFCPQAPVPQPAPQAPPQAPPPPARPHRRGLPPGRAPPPPPQATVAPPACLHPGPPCLVKQADGQNGSRPPPPEREETIGQDRGIHRIRRIAKPFRFGVKPHQWLMAMPPEERFIPSVIKQHCNMFRGACDTPQALHDIQSSGCF